MNEALEKEELQSSDGIVARQVAFSILKSIFLQKRNFDEAINLDPRFNTLPGRDRAFVRLLTSIVLKRSTQIDQVLQEFLTEPLEDLKPTSLLYIFRLGFAQFAFLKTPAHASVNTTVMLAKAEGIKHQTPLVNAVMRRLTREGFPEMDERDAGKINTPEWLWHEWMNDYGVETALDIAAANFGEASLDISVKDRPEHWADRLGAALLPTGSLRKQGGGFIPDMDGFEEGEWWIQNASAALPAKLFGDVSGKTVVDLCAAPGGKTAQLAARGAHVIAVDRSAERSKRLKENMERLHFDDVEIVIADGAVWAPKELVDFVLLDAPCTATGTVRHQPDLLHLKTPKDQEKLAALQRRLLLNAVKMLKQGGTLIYCTCSLQKEEGEHQIDWLLSENEDIKFSPIVSGEVEGISEMLTERGEIRSLPSHWKEVGGVDGFYIARLKMIK